MVTERLNILGHKITEELYDEGLLIPSCIIRTIQTSKIQHFVKAVSGF